MVDNMLRSTRKQEGSMKNWLDRLKDPSPVTVRFSVI